MQITGFRPVYRPLELKCVGRGMHDIRDPDITDLRYSYDSLQNGEKCKLIPC